MAEHQQYESEQAQYEVQQGQFYPAFTSQDGYQVPGGLFHAPNVVQVPGQSFVGPPLQMMDGQALLQAAPTQFQSTPLQIGIPGGFQFMPSVESQFSYYPETNDEPAEPAMESFKPRTRDATIVSKKDSKGCWSWCNNIQK